MSSAEPFKELRIVQRAYVIVWWRDESSGEVLCLSGRENAVHQRALAQLLATAAPPGIEIDENGADRSKGVGKNLSGVLLIGRTALPGGRVDRGETFEEAAVRELSEEFGMSVDLTELEPLGDGTPVRIDSSDIRFFALNLAGVFPFPANTTQAANIFVAAFKPNSDKRSIEVVPLAQLPKLLERPDAADIAFLEQEMAKLATALEPGSVVAADHLADSLCAFQKSRPLAHQVDAVTQFAEKLKNV